MQIGEMPMSPETPRSVVGALGGGTWDAVIAAAVARWSASMKLSLRRRFEALACLAGRALEDEARWDLLDVGHVVLSRAPRRHQSGVVAVGVALGPQ